MAKYISKTSVKESNKYSNSKVSTSNQNFFCFCMWFGCKILLVKVSKCYSSSHLLKDKIWLTVWNFYLPQPKIFLAATADGHMWFLHVIYFYLSLCQMNCCLQSPGWRPIFLVAWCLLRWFANKENSMVMCDTEWPYWDQVSLNYIKLKTQMNCPK